MAETPRVATMAYDEKETTDYDKILGDRRGICLTRFLQSLSLIGDLHGKSIVDIGTGPGEMPAEFERRGARVVGVDQSADWIKKCNERYGMSDTLRFVQTNGGDLTNVAEDGSLDAITMNLVVPNVAEFSELGSIFSEAGRALRSGGVFIISDISDELKMMPESDGPVPGSLTPDRWVKRSEGFSLETDGAEYMIGLRSGSGLESKIVFKNKNYSRATLIRLAKYFGLHLYSQVSTAYTTQHSKLLQEYKIPEYSVFTFVKE